MLQAWQTPGLSNGFFGRLGGVSRGPFSSLNLSSSVGDDPAAVCTNWERIREKLGPHRTLARVAQMHGSVVRVVDSESSQTCRPGDGMVTADPGVLLCVFTADCVPLLMADPKRRIVAAVHAGWRGILAAVAASAVTTMTELGADARAIRAALGPSIGPCCFEVDVELAARFEREIVGAAGHVSSGREGKAMLDLRGILREQLLASGLEPAAINEVGPCTRCAADRFFSRRATGGRVSGLQLSFVGFAL